MPTTSRLTTDQVWRHLSRRSFAVISYVTPSGEPRCSGVVYKAVGRRLYVATNPNSWKARHIARRGKVAVTVPIRRGGLLSLVTSMPPATVTFHATAIVHPADSPEIRARAEAVLKLAPPERRASDIILEIIPEATFLTYGVGVSLMKMLDPTAAQGRVAVG